MSAYQALPTSDYGESVEPPPNIHRTGPGSFQGRDPGGQRAMPIVNVVSTNTVTSFFGELPVTMTCPYCHSTIVTNIQPVAGTKTWLICGLLTLFGCVLGCCLIPFCSETMQDTQHLCPSCNAVLGRYKRM